MNDEWWGEEVNDDNINDIHLYKYHLQTIKYMIDEENIIILNVVINKKYIIIN